MNQVFVISGGWWLPGQRMEPGDSVALEMTNVRTAADRMLAREIRLHALIRRNRSMDFADGGFQPSNTAQDDLNILYFKQIFSFSLSFLDPTGSLAFTLLISE